MGAGDASGPESRSSGQRGQKVLFPLWIVVAKDGPRTTVKLKGEWVFSNHLPQEVQASCPRRDSCSRDLSGRTGRLGEQQQQQQADLGMG